MFASAGAELVSLGAVMPFLVVLSDPSRLWQHPLVKDLAVPLGFTSANDLLIPVTLIFAAASIFAALVRLTNLWLNGRLAAAVGSDLSCEAYQRTLNQPYAVHVQRNSATVITAATVHISQTVSAFSSLLQIATSSMVATGLFIGLLLINAPVALSGLFIFGGAYGILAFLTRRELRLNSQKIVEASTQQLKALQEGLGAIRDVLLDGTQYYYVSSYQQADFPQRLLQANNAFIGTFPRFALEAVGMVGIALLGGILVFQNGSSNGTIPLLGSLALGAQRLLPALQQIYSGWSVVKGCDSALNSVLELLNQPLPAQFNASKPLQLSKSICLEQVYFSYGLEKTQVLSGVDLEIRRGERIGLIGSTGSGKSTALDILMGLLVPSSGRVLIDGIDLHDPKYPDRINSWRSIISHVPQSIFLADSTIAENIAFGVPRNEIDMSRVYKAAKQAQIHQFIESGSQGYEAFVGERGMRLSGGQRQRIGIARALYKNAQILIFDEATSALDTPTEKSLMEAIDGLSEKLTIIMIAHRLSTLDNCDRVIRLADGALISVADHTKISDYRSI